MKQDRATEIAEGIGEYEMVRDLADAEAQLVSAAMARIDRIRGCDVEDYHTKMDLFDALRNRRKVRAVYGLTDDEDDLSE